MSTTTVEELVDEDIFREAMGNICTPVAVVTARDSRGQPYGTTVSAFCSLSLAPPMILIALDRGSGFLSVVRESGVFGVNILSTDAEDAGKKFARKGKGDFTSTEWHWHDGVPRLASNTFFRCTTAGLLDGGDHVIVTGLVHAVGLGEGAPLTYHQRTFGTHAAISGTPGR
ncbi:flavin reductase family protein [Rhodococcus sp. T2V]|uniref:flavin reductase family protein n=1 Tax=Rhodococcus sp. T2V TaxID=3034164 RepID=UPI0023E14E8C|nr:flavin reductase family protein [Rhodococcus sp. T2V]MDF3307981.1 flavin reductase family protein [Rhodococcus sp. T2V]